MAELEIKEYVWKGEYDLGEDSKPWHTPTEKEMTKGVSHLNVSAIEMQTQIALGKEPPLRRLDELKFR